MDAVQHRKAIAEQGNLVANLPADGLHRPVPACPGWHVERLIGHLGRVHVWASNFLAADPDDPGTVSGGPRPPAGAAVLPWYRESLNGLLAELDRHDPSETAGTFAGPSTAAFWYRRQAHEIAVHRWDAQDAMAPGAASPVPAELAVDGIDEWLDLFVPRFLARRTDPMPPDLVGASLHLHCTDDELGDGAGEWLVRLSAEGAEVERSHSKGDAALRGPASDLLLAVWHRLRVDRLDAVGDIDRARAVLELIHVT